MEYKNGTDFLNKLYKDMHMSDAVMHTKEKGDTPVEKIDRYLNRLEKVHDIAKTNEHKMNLLKKFYYEKYVIKDLPNSYVELQQRMAKELGYGNINVDDIKKQEMLSHVKREQGKSLDSWIDYLCSDDAIYPMWFKNYAFQGMIKLGKYDKEKKKFKKRSSTTTEPFLDLNREVLAKVYDVLSKEIGKEELTEEEIKGLENGESFNKLYIYYLTKQNSNSNDKETEGIWIKYDQGSDSKKLCDSLQGKNTGWCTAGYETAKIQLSNGDFYVYYTKDDNDEYKNPRIAIRMNGHSEIGEVRGIGKNQNIESNMTDIANDKLNDFADKEKYIKKVQDMKQLTKIEEKVKKQGKLTKEELLFLYEIEDIIEGFGYEKDSRIDEIRSQRNVKHDLATIYDVSEENIATSLSDFDHRKVVVYYGDLSYSSKLNGKLGDLKAIFGDADFEKLRTVEGLNNLQKIDGAASFGFLTTAEGLNNLEIIGGNLFFSFLKTAEGLNNLKTIGGYAYFDSLTTAEGLDNLETIGGNALFRRLTTVEGLNNLKTIGGNADFKRLTTVEGLNNLETIGGNANFRKLTTVEGLNNLKTIGGNADFRSLITAEGLNNLEIIGGYADFRSLTIAEGLEHCNKYNKIKEDIEIDRMLHEKNNEHKIDDKTK